ncbi:MAG TPA: helix-turn-helix transcriptional regulator [Gemmatimonadaceae bacterium]
MSRPRPLPHSELHERHLLYESLGVSVVDFRCRAHVEPDGPEEPNPTHSIVLVRRGVFRRTWRGDACLADPNHVLFFNAAEPSSFAHPLPGGDDCTILTVDAQRAVELVARHSPEDVEDPETPFRVGHAPSSRHVARLHFELLARIRRRDAALVVDDTLSELADESVRVAYRTRTGLEPRRTVSAATRRRHHDLTEAVKLAINQRLESPPRLSDLGRALGCSPFHLSRIFRETAGVRLRRYTQQLRARMAADRLTRGARNLTELALDLGYSDHSHLTNAFRREWGLPPSRFKAPGIP